MRCSYNWIWNGQTPACYVGQCTMQVHWDQPGDDGQGQAHFITLGFRVADSNDLKKKFTFNKHFGGFSKTGRLCHIM
jgi:hypothetical protein